MLIFIVLPPLFIALVGAIEHWSPARSLAVWMAWSVFVFLAIGFTFGFFELGLLVVVYLVVSALAAGVFVLVGRRAASAA